MPLTTPPQTEPASEIAVESLRWVAFVAGESTTVDYHPRPSDGVSDALAREVSLVCRMFHPEAGATRLRAPALLFWRPTTHEDGIAYAITRVRPLPVADSERRAFEYVTLLFTSDQFDSTVGRDPYRALATDWHDRVRDRDARGETAPLVIPSRMETEPVHPERITSRFAAGGFFPWSPEAERELEQFVRTSAASGSPRSFATWWLESQNEPQRYFDIVLSVGGRSEHSVAERVREAAVRALSAANQSGNATVTEGATMVERAAVNVHEAQWGLTDPKGEADWSQRMAAAADDLLSASVRFEASGVPDTGKELAQLADELRSERHPRSGRTPVIPPREAGGKQRGGNLRLVIVATLIGALVGATLATLFLRSLPVKQDIVTSTPMAAPVKRKP